MRPEIKNFDWHVYGLSDVDFEYTVRLVKDMIESWRVRLEKEAQEVRAKDAQMMVEILDDKYYYAWIDTQFLWHFCLWRLQGIFEGIILQDFLPDSRYMGLKAKLDGLRTAGYAIEGKLYQELLDWARLRNALSHFPPEQYRPLNVKEADMQEYVGLLKSVLNELRRQKDHT